MQNQKLHTPSWISFNYKTNTDINKKQIERNNIVNISAESAKIETIKENKKITILFLSFLKSLTVSFTLITAKLLKKIHNIEDKTIKIYFNI